MYHHIILQLSDESLFFVFITAFAFAAAIVIWLLVFFSLVFEQSLDAIFFRPASWQSIFGTQGI